MPDEASDRSSDVRTLRAQAAVLISQARGQIADLQHALAAAPAGSPLQSRLAAAAAQTSAAIGTLAQSLDAPGATLRPSDLMALESVVFSGGATALVAEAKAETAGAAAVAQTVSATSAATRQEVQADAHDLFERKIFDPYLHFASPEDEAAYRQHEADARRYVEQQLARHTPEGDLNAGGGMMGQMLQAHAHGAGDSPDFLPRWNALAAKVERQHAAMRAAGQSTEEFDRNLTNDVRRFLKAKGLSDTEIDQRLAGGADPLKVVEPFMKDDAASRRFEQLARWEMHTDAAAPNSATLPRVVAVSDTPASPAPSAIDFDKLRNASLSMTDVSEPSGHGLATQKSTARPAVQLGG